MPQGDILESRFVCVAGVQVGINVRHWERTQATGGDVSNSSVGIALLNRLMPLYQAVISSVSAVSGIGITKIHPLPRGMESVSTFGANMGQVAGDILPLQVSGLITVRSALAGPGGRGRIYIPFPGETDNDGNGHPVITHTDRMSSLAAGYFTSLLVTEGPITNTFNARIWKRMARVAVPVTSMTARPNWATQRRRGEFGRPNNLPPGFPDIGA